MALQAIALRPLHAEDETALFTLFSRVRAEELAMDTWEPALRQTVLRQQFDAQRRGRRADHPAAREYLIVFDEQPVGWTVLDRSGPTWRCVDIAIAIEFRRRRFASEVLRRFQQEAASSGCRVGLMLLRSNAAARALYDGLGFRLAGETDTHWYMEWLS
jgi:ribosomal protein S18 acetylase RimI-like enzyme